jgi:hypothetical protein
MPCALRTYTELRREYADIGHASAERHRENLRDDWFMMKRRIPFLSNLMSNLTVPLLSFLLLCVSLCLLCVTLCKRITHYSPRPPLTQYALRIILPTPPYADPVYLSFVICHLFICSFVIGNLPCPS